ncbi:hypothetical protein [Haemophilus haemolyticus]|jgi:hypothetical protein|uniref:hypothetical protein n=1 Tax=Haemophilus haemolyticus TaxID=726 RepID=UPI000E0D2109|nr:hypothetical protein [Haemophilus haemolyticus]
MKKLILASTACLLLSGCFSELPKCDDTEVKKTLDSMITTNLRTLDRSLKFIDVKNIEETGFNKNKEIRLCTADILISNGEEESIIYNIHWQNKKNSMFYVEIQE